MREKYQAVTQEEAREALVGILNDAKTAEEEWGYLGILNDAGTEYEFFIPEKPGYIHCMIQRAVGQEYAECVVRVALDPFVPVKFVRFKGVLVATEFDPLRAVQQYGSDAPALGVPSLPMPDVGGVFPPPVFGSPATKIIDAGVASAGNDRFITLSAETGTADDCIELQGLAVGDEAWLFAASGHTITLKHDDAGATDKFLFSQESDIELSDSKGLKVVKKATGAVVNSIDEGAVGAFTDLTDVPNSYSGQAGKFVVVNATEDELEFVTSAASEVGAKLRRVGTVLHDETLGSSGSFDVTSISQDYDDLEVILEGRSDANSSGGVNNFNFSLNNDTTDANYHFQQISGSGSTASAITATQRLIGAVPGADATAGKQGLTHIFIPDYTRAIFKQVQALFTTHNTTRFAIFRSMEWQDTSAINRITVAVANADTDFETGTRLRIIGWKTEAIGGSEYSEAAVSSPPTAAELASAFGSASAVGAGYTAIVNDSGGGTDEYFVWSDGTDYWYVEATKAT